MCDDNAAKPLYFRRDQKDGITGPNLAHRCTYAEHIVHARGKVTQYTSITLDGQKCRDMGEATYRLLRPEVDDAGHAVVEHVMLVTELEKVARSEEKADRLRAIRALQYAKRRLEGLVEWKIDISLIAPKDVMERGRKEASKFFSKV